MRRDNTSDFRHIFLAETPLMDVRAPVEFQKGAFPTAVNLPLMNDAERQQVGTCYKSRGQEAAISLGRRLVSGQVKDERLQAWTDFTRQHPEGFLYCFRGGLRSQITQQWLAEAGIHYPRVLGGYKDLRNFLIDTTQSTLDQCDVILVGGLTGSGKTELLACLDNAIDLEGHARHRGSSFGALTTPQPAQIDFENALAIDLLRKHSEGWRQLVLEEEGRTIGNCFLPLSLVQRMPQYRLVWLEDGLEARVERILCDYVVKPASLLQQRHGSAEGFAMFSERLRESLRRIAKRLGAQRYQCLAERMDKALAEHDCADGVDMHRDWIEVLLREYYDPMYAFQREAKADRIVFSGERDAVIEYLKAHSHTQPCP